MEQTKLFSICISYGQYKDFVHSIIRDAGAGVSAYACVANVHMLMEAYRNASFAQAVNNAAVVTPDGKPLTWGMKLLNGINQERVAGMDLLPDLLREAEQKELPVFFYGGSQSMLAETGHFMQQNFPQLRIAGVYSPPFRPLTPEEEEAVVEKINASGARLTFVVLGCPKQEKWMAAMKGRIQTYMVGVGGALPVLIGQHKRAPKWMQANGLEWLYRLAQEPARLFKRYAITNSLFLYLFFKAYLHKNLFQRLVN